MSADYNRGYPLEHKLSLSVSWTCPEVMPMGASHVWSNSSAVSVLMSGSFLPLIGSQICTYAIANFVPCCLAVPVIAFPALFIWWEFSRFIDLVDISVFAA